MRECFLIRVFCCNQLEGTMDIGDADPRFTGRRSMFKVARHPSIASQPVKGALYHLAPRQYDKPLCQPLAIAWPQKIVGAESCPKVRSSASVALG